MIDLETRVYKNENVPWRIIEDEAILVEVKKGEVIHLNDVGAKIWDLIDGENTVQDIVLGVVGAYEVDEDTARQDALCFISEVLEKGLAAVRDE